MLSLVIKVVVNTDALKPRKVKGAPKPSHSAGSRRSVTNGSGAGSLDTDTALDEGEALLAAVKAIVLDMDPNKRRALQRLLQTADSGAPMNAYACVCVHAFPREHKRYALVCNFLFARLFVFSPVHV